MKIQLIAPPNGHEHPPLSLLTIAPYFERFRNTTVSLFDSNEHPHTEPSADYDLHCITANSFQLGAINRIAFRLIEKNPRCKIIVGGPAVTFSPDHARDVLTFADQLVSGDGEHYAADFVEHLKNGAHAYGEIVRSPPYDFHSPEHLMPSWHLCNWKKYSETSGFGVETSRGCPYHCYWCSAHFINGTWRGRHVGSIVAEINTLKRWYGCHKFYFPDDNATADPNRWRDLMQELATLNKSTGRVLELSAPEGLQANHLPFETLAFMKKAGFSQIIVGAESGVQRVLDCVINKPALKIEQVRQLVKDCKSLKIRCGCFFVIGTLGETLEEAKETVRFAEELRHLGAESCMVRSALPVPGTKMCNDAIRNGNLTVPQSHLYDFDLLHSGKHLLISDEWSPADIESLVAQSKEADRKHISRQRTKRLPQRIFRKIKRSVAKI